MIRTLKHDDPLAIAAIAKTASPEGATVTVEEYADWTEGCDTCSYWEEGFAIYVDNRHVFEQKDYDAFGKLLDWLTNNEEEA